MTPGPFEWTPLIVGVITATAALSGVLLTQYSQRRLSQESRVWQERARLYVELIAWGRNVEYLVRPWSATGPMPAWDMTPVLTDDAWDRAWAYGSSEVLQRASILRQMLADYKKSPTNDKQFYEQRARSVEQAARALRILARNELQDGRRQRGKPWRPIQNPYYP